MITIFKNVHHCHGQCCHSGGTRHASNSTFQFRHPLLKRFDRRIIDSCVRISCTFIGKNLLQFLCRIMTECTGLVDRYLCRAVRITVLAPMKQSCIKTVFFHSCAPLFSLAVLMVLLYTYKHTMSIGFIGFFYFFPFFYHRKGSRTHLFLL